MKFFRLLFNHGNKSLLPVLLLVFLVIGIATFSFQADLASAQTSGQVTPADQMTDKPGSGGFVICGNEWNNPCRIDHLFIALVMIINYLISVAGLVALLFIVIAGVQMIASRGEGMLVTAKKRLTGAIIGLVLVALAFVLVNSLVAGSFALGIRNGGLLLTNPREYIMQQESKQEPSPATEQPSSQLPNFFATYAPGGITVGDGAGIEKTGVDPNAANKEVCSRPIKMSYFRLFKTASAQTKPPAYNCLDSLGYLQGPTSDTFSKPAPTGLGLARTTQQYFPEIKLGKVVNEQFTACSDFARSGCGIASMVHALRYLENRGYDELGDKVVNYNNARRQWMNSNPGKKLPSSMWVEITMDKMRTMSGFSELVNAANNSAGKPAFTCNVGKYGGAIDNSTIEFMFNDNLLKGIRAQQVNSLGQFTSKIDFALSKGGVAIVNMGPTNGRSIFTSGGHYVLIWHKFQHTDLDKKTATWYAVADSNDPKEVPRYVTHVRQDIMEASYNRGNPTMTIIYPQ